jgi:hypothetical protein
MWQLNVARARAMPKRREHFSTESRRGHVPAVMRHKGVRDLIRDEDHESAVVVAATSSHRDCGLPK